MNFLVRFVYYSTAVECEDLDNITENFVVFSDYEQKPIRLSDERWQHINERHPETLGQEALIRETLPSPDFVQEGGKGARLAIRKFKKTPISEDKHCAVVYKPLDPEGFMITAYFTRRPSFRRSLIWKK